MADLNEKDVNIDEAVEETTADVVEKEDAVESEDEATTVEEEAGLSDEQIKEDLDKASEIESEDGMASLFDDIGDPDLPDGFTTENKQGTGMTCSGPWAWGSFGTYKLLMERVDKLERESRTHSMLSFLIIAVFGVLIIMLNQDLSAVNENIAEIIKVLMNK